MPSIPLHPPQPLSSTCTSPLPSLLHTPTGLALLEIQGQLHTSNTPSSSSAHSIDIGRLEFPLYEVPSNHAPFNPAEDARWMKKVYLYVGAHQRLTGELRALPKAIAILRKREGTGNDGREEGKEELEIVEIVKYKILFAGRPEPVGG